MDLSEINRICDFARLNKGETDNLPYNLYEVKIWSDDHNPPHFHVESKQEGFDIRCSFDGELLSVKRYGSRGRQDTFRDIIKRVKNWLDSKPQGKNNPFPTNRDYVKFVWEREVD